jgi:dipeptidyl aminopeptidase/acylaminoacyl peptidase
MLVTSFFFSQSAWANEVAENKSSVLPVRDFFRNPETAGYSISPDGNRLAFLKPYEHRLNIFIKETDKVKRVTSVIDRDIDNYFWKNDEIIIYNRDFGGDENYHIFAVNIKNGTTKDLTPFKGVKSNVMDELRCTENEVLITMNKRNPEVFDVYRLNVITGELKLEVENPGNFTGYLADHQGTVRIAYAQDVNTGNKLIYYRQTADQPFANILSMDFQNDMTPYSFDASNKEIYATSNLARDKEALVLFNPETVKEESVLFEHPEVDISTVVMSEKRNVLVGVGYVTDKLHRHFFDESMHQLYEHLQKRLGNDEFTITSTDKNEDKFIVVVYSDIDQGTYYFYDAINDQLSELSASAPWQNKQDLAAMQPIQYTSRDGYTIHGYLTLPKGRDSKNLPVVINPHGGPWVRDYWGYDPEVQFLANRGYAVLQMNYRGSAGYGKAFLNAGNKQWGKKMQDDITDGVNWLVSKGIADPKRVAIYGGSYGGYATLAGLAFTPDKYACGVDLVGPSNLFTLLETIPPYWKPEIAEFYERMGNPQKDNQLLHDVSPIFHVEQIKAPLFVAQGANDPRVNINESDQIVSALRVKGIPVEYMVKQNEGHGFANEENRIDFYKEMEKFLAKYL